MIEVLNLVNKIRLACKKYNDSLAKRLNIRPNLPPLNGFTFCHQYCVTTLELLDFYYNIWGNPNLQIQTSKEQAIQENAQRIITQTKSMYILAMSGFEFSIKECILNNSTKICPPSGRIYLSKIITLSERASVI